MTRRSFLVAAAGFGLAAAVGCRQRATDLGKKEAHMGGDAGSGKDCFRPGEVWLDTDGRPIQAHGGGVLFDRGTYYWFGENKEAPTERGFLRRVDVVGVNCYSSTDLYHWKNEGLVLPAVPDDPDHDLHPDRVVERPKVIHNERTKRYVMWMHIDTSDYQYARTGVAVSESPTGPYEYQGSFRPNGADSRDMTVFKDDGGAAYLLHASEWNKTLHVARLSEDYLKPVGESARSLVGQEREAPAVFRRADRCYLITSGCSGWAPNAADCAVSDSVMGPWQSQGNPCIGSAEEVATTFHSQSTFVLPVQGREDAFIFMADRWNPRSLGDSRYVWLPIEFEGDRLALRWRDSWDLSVFD
ncbi:MAG: glycoside hydrolase family 43 protein [Armatimonadota bacterium]